MSVDITGDDRIEVVGESFYRAALKRIAAAGGTSRVLSATLRPEPSNPYDRNAVRVEIDGELVGHIPRDLAEMISGPVTELARDGPVTAKAELRGEGDSELGFGVVLWIEARRLGLAVEGDEDGTPDFDVPEMIGAMVESRGADADDPIADEAFGRRRAIVERAVESWKTELIDLSGRNRLLYMRDLRAGTLSFDESARAALMELVAGNRVALSRIIPRTKQREHPQMKLTPFEDAVRRMRTIVRTARTYAEERGVRTLFLACGVATWRSDRASRPPAAPVLLVPLEIKPRGASQQDFDLSLAGELEVNPTLLHMLKVEFNLDIDDRELHEHNDMDGVIDTPEELRLSYDWLSGKARRVADWAISDRFVVGNFWYAKLPMVKDLEASIDLLTGNDVAAAFAGDAEARAKVSAARHDDRGAAGDVDSLAPTQEFNILDSDSSQSLAIARARRGENLVLRGPPGTGKSQTIANLICTAVGEGKRVLFVAEKRAAIEAVTKRLEGADLGGLVLDLHRGSESRKWLAAQLAESLAAIGRSVPVDTLGVDGRLERSRASLRDHAVALHQKAAPWDLSVFDAQMGVLSIGRPSVITRLRGPDLERVGESELDQLTELLRDLLVLEGLSLNANESPWSAAVVESGDTVREADRLLSDLGERGPRLLARISGATGSPETTLPVPTNLAQSAELLDLWADVRCCSERFDLTLFEADLTGMTTNLEPLNGSAIARLIASLTSSDYKGARDGVRAHMKGTAAASSPRELFTALEECRAVQAAWHERALTQGPPSFPSDLDAIREETDAFVAGLQRLSEISGRDLVSFDFSEIASSLAESASHRDTLVALPRISAAKARFADYALSGFLQELEEDQALLKEAQSELRRVWWMSLTDHLMGLPAADGLVAFRGDLQNHLAQEFKASDKDHIKATAGQVSRLAAQKAVAAMDKFPEQAQLVRAQAKRKRGHLPIRDFFDRAPAVVTSLRPCWVMSPLLVSQLIPAGREFFDLVIFDEASQVRPVDALTSIVRGRQLVVAGDEHQLPPTVFFDATATGDEGQPEEEEGTDTADFESLLDFLMTLFDAEMLRWHYRSRDERLISFSNLEIYNGGLTTFPGVVSDDVLRHVLIEQTPAEGDLRVSPRAEVERVVELVIEHATDRPGESLGVIALGIRHAEAIEEGLLAAMPDHAQLEPFFAEDRDERFFVKNLERVQGDERDAIILAVGYGKDPEGTLPHRFGPLNTAGGERRLNVAITRAKRRMTVVSSFKADDIDERRSGAKGVRLLRAYLDYAGRGGEVSELSSAADCGTPVHAQIAAALNAAGLESRLLVGVSADRIDVAAVDPVSGLPKVAIEMDGSSYAARPSVRDRDRLRPEQLERLGWGHVGTWTQDWYRDPAGAAGRLIDQVKDLMTPSTNGTAPVAGDGADDGVRRDEPDDAAPREETGGRPRPPRPSFPVGRSAITDWPITDLVQLGKWIESDGRLRTEEELRAALMDELGIKRKGSRVVRILDEVVALVRA
jgi:hypothetical protein